MEACGVGLPDARASQPNQEGIAMAGCGCGTKKAKAPAKKATKKAK